MWPKSAAWIVVLCLLLVPPASSAVSAQAESFSGARLILFHSPDCPYCRQVIEHILPPLQAAYGDQLQVLMYDLKTQDGYGVYAALHAQYVNLPGGIPQAYIDRYVLVGSDQIQNELPRIIDACLAGGGCDWPFQVQLDNELSPLAEDASTGQEPVYLAYCFDPSCLECDRVKYDLEHLQDRYPNLVVREFNIREDAALIEAMCARFNVPEDRRLLAPAIFVSDVYLAQDDISLTRLVSFIENPDPAVSAPPWQDISAESLDVAASSIASRFQGFSALTVGLAGLLDGVNPCAFTTLIFFVSYLALVGREKRDVLLVGTAFTTAVFLTYLTMGLGFSAFVERLGSASLIGRFVYGLTAAICILFAVLSLWDYRKIRQGKTAEILLQLPKSIKKRIHQTIRAHTRMRGYIVAAFAAGVLVSVFELACTGQVYLPTIVFMTRVETMRVPAIAYLVLYNLMFVVPLIAVFAVTYIGVSDKRLAVIFERRIGLVKLLTAALFGMMGIWLGWMVFAA